MTAQTDSLDLTLDETRLLLAPLIARNAAFDGWNVAAVASAAEQKGIDADVAHLACGDSAVDMIDAWFASIDAEMAVRLPPETLQQMGMTKRIATLLETRLEIALPEREALRRAVAILAMPQNAAKAAKLAWRSADTMWRLAGDTATDFNHYTKRMTLSAVYTSTVAVFLNDESEDLGETRAFLARRIGNVMQFEKWKANARKRREMRPSIARFVGRLRYPQR